MEYVQTVLVQIAAMKLDEASGPGGLLSELEAHRDFASAQAGFRGMRLTRTANPEGDVLVVVETRWANNNALADYSTLRQNAAAIAEQHESETVPGSLQVHRMEALATDRSEAPTRIYDRLALPLLLPLGVLAFAVLVIYGLSRIYLSIPQDAATPLAASIALAVLGISFYFAANPNVPRWQIAGVVAAAVAVLAVGGTAAAIYDEGNKEYKEPPTPVASSPPTGPTTAPGAPELIMTDNAFNNTSLTVKSGDVVAVTNSGAAVHNVHIGGSDESFQAQFCRANGPEPCTKPAAVPGGATATLTVNLPPGTYAFRCDFHPQQMKGTITVQ